MTDPISFDPFLGWVDTTDPNNIPVDVRIISAADLLRYENFGVATTTAVNSIITDVADTKASQGTAITDLQGAIDGFGAIAALEQFIFKPTNQSRTNSTLMAADADLHGLLHADNTYVVEAVLFMQSPVTADFRVYLDCPGVTGFWGVTTGLATTATTTEGPMRPLAYNQFDGTGFALVGGTDYSSMVTLKGVIKVPVGSNPTLRVFWAQGTVDSGNTIVIANSYLHTRAV